MPWILRLLIYVTVILILEFYFFKKFFNSVRILFPNSPILKLKKTRNILLFIINLTPVTLIGFFLFELITGIDMERPGQNLIYDIFFLYPFWFSILIILQAIVLLIPIDLIRLFSFPFLKTYRENIKKWNARLILSISLLALLYVPSRIIYDMTQVSVRETEYRIPNLHKDLEGLKIGLISDIQADWYNPDIRVENYIDKLNEANSDVVFIAGDMITRGKDYIPNAAEAAGKIRSKFGVYACIGDHDNWAYDDIYYSRSQVIKSLAEYNIEMHHNKNIEVKFDSAKVGISFITYTYSDRIVSSLLDSITTNNNGVDFKILLTHQPKDHLLEKAIENDYNLMFAGHTHGGQITVLFPFINLTPTLIETSKVKGDFWFGDLLMIVNRGLGMSLVPIRYNSTPEVTMIVLRNGESAAASKAENNLEKIL